MMDESSLPIGFMVWRIGELLDPYAQIAWLAAHGFEAVGIHAAAGKPGVWRGIPPEAGAGERRRLRAAWHGFASREVHAPINLRISAETTPGDLAQFEKVLEFAADAGAGLVTMHAAAPPAAAAGFTAALDYLNSRARALGLRIGIEVTRGFDAFIAPPWDRIGFTFDLGHMYLPGAGLAAPAEAIPPLLHRLRGKIINVHLHDVDDVSDHAELGTGRVDIAGCLRTLAEIETPAPLCLELDPGRVAPEGILRSAEFARRCRERSGGRRKDN